MKTVHPALAQPDSSLSRNRSAKTWNSRTMKMIMKKATTSAHSTFPKLMSAGSRGREERSTNKAFRRIPGRRRPVPVDLPYRPPR